MSMRNHKIDFSRAVELHRSGRLGDAERMYRKILVFDPHHADSLHLLGLVASEAGQHDTAAALISRAIQAAGPVAMYCSNLGLVFGRMGKPEQAIACYRQALRNNPADPGTHARLGRLLLESKDFTAARVSLEKSLALQPQAAVFCDLGTVLFAQQEFDAAGKAYEIANVTDPAYPEALYNLGVIRTIQRRPAEAMAFYRAALALRPAYPDAHNNLGILLQSTGQGDAALNHYRQALQCDPASSEARYNGAFLLQERDHLEGARDEYQELLRRHPEHFEGHNNLGNTLLSLAEPELALAEYNTVLQLQPGHAEAHWNRAIANLTLGNFREGWEEYEWRFRQPQSAQRKPEPPSWTGESLNNRRLLLQAEQGLGDTLQFVRYASLVKELGAFVMLECQQPLQRLLSRHSSVDRTVLSNSDEVDYRAPLMSLPGLFGTTLATIPSQAPYLHADPHLIEKWARLIRERVGADDFRVGLCWAGNPLHRNDRNRSVPVEAFAALAGLPGIVFFCLQKDAQFRPPLPFATLPEQVGDFDDTAALIANLDLVITVDTAVAHLAGGLGQQVWILLPFAPDWRWMMDRSDSPWYPSARLFRQPRRKDWTSVIQNVRSELSLKI